MTGVNLSQIEEVSIKILLPKVNKKATIIDQIIVIIENEGIELHGPASPRKKIHLIRKTVKTSKKTWMLSIIMVKIYGTVSSTR